MNAVKEYSSVQWSCRSSIANDGKRPRPSVTSL